MSDDRNDDNAFEGLTTLVQTDRTSKGFNLFALSPKEEREYIARLEEAFLKHDTLTIASLKDSGAPFTHRMLEAAFVHRDRSLTRLCLDHGVAPKDSFVKEVIETASRDNLYLPVLREIVMHGMISETSIELLKEKGMANLLECARPKIRGQDSSAHPKPGIPSASVKLN